MICQTLIKIELQVWRGIMIWQILILLLRIFHQKSRLIQHGINHCEASSPKIVCLTDVLDIRSVLSHLVLHCKKILGLLI